jgi:hypothetical protein
VPVHDEMMQGVVRVIGDDHPALEPGLRNRVVIGTGFIVSIPSQKHTGARYNYIVTAAHVVADQTSIEVQAAIPTSSGGLHPAVIIRDWSEPLDKADLAIARFKSSQEVATIPEDSMVPNHLVSRLGLGGEVAYVGILAPLDRPMVRTGTVGALDQEHLGLNEYEYPAHLIDCRSYEGFSGSPVFALIAKPYLDHTDTYRDRPLGQMAYFAFLAGMFTAHLSEEKHWAPARYGVGVMLRSSEIRRALLSEPLRKEREETDNRLQRRARSI